MDADHQYAQYRTQAVRTASPAALVGMLYQGALAAVERAEVALRDPDEPARELAHRELVRAQDIVTELLVTLDHDRGGEVAPGLAALYDFCLDRLVTANVTKDPAPLDAVRSVLAELAGAWATVEKEVGSAPSPLVAVAG